MPPTETLSAVPEIQHNELAHLQLEIARLADQLFRPVELSRNTDLVLWLKAEQEVFARYSNARGNMTAA